MRCAASRAIAHSTASRTKRALVTASVEIFITNVPRCGSTRSKPVLAELDEGLAHRLTAHVEPPGDVLLGQRLPGLEPHGHDRGAQRAKHLLGDRGRAPRAAMRRSVGASSSRKAYCVGLIFHTTISV